MERDYELYLAQQRGEPVQHCRDYMDAPRLARFAATLRRAERERIVPPCRETRSATA